MMVRVDHSTGKLPYPGDKNVILEAFKPGTQPSVTTDGGEGPQHFVDDEDAASLATIGGGEPIETLPSTAVSSETGQPAPVQQISPGPRQEAPSTGTGGLY